MANGSDVHRFSTRDWPEKDRFEGWRQIVGKAIMQLEIDPVADEVFRANVQLHTLPGLGLAKGHASPMRARRTTSLIDNDDLVLSVMLQGTAEFRQHGKQVEVHAGDALLHSAGDILQGSAGTVGMKLLRIPRAALSPAVKNIDAAVMRVIPPNVQALRLLSSYADLVRSMPAPIELEAAELAARHIHDLFALTIGSTRDAAAEIQARGVKAARLAIIRANIARSAIEPGFSIGVVAQQHGLSERYIQMLLAESGTTFTDLVIGERLGHAHRALSDPLSVEKPIGIIALEAGFSDLSYFNRVFRRHYGASPGEIRAVSHQDDPWDPIP